jgi:hypothetical protein
MKRDEKKPGKKLVLKTATLRRLTPDQIRQAVGGCGDYSYIEDPLPPKKPAVQ